MNGILKIIKEWTLLLAILFGGVFHSFFGYIYSTFPFITPLLIFIMLLLTFSKLEKISIKVGSLHIKLLLIQLALSVLAYGVGRLFNNELAQGLLICVLVPTATSAAVITNLLKVDIKFITSYLLFSNVIMAFIIPIFLAYVGTQTEQGVLVSMFILAKKVLPTILLPIILLVLIKRVAPKVHVQLQRASGATFLPMVVCPYLGYRQNHSYFCYARKRIVCNRNHLGSWLINRLLASIWNGSHHWQEIRRTYCCGASTRTKEHYFCHLVGTNVFISISLCSSCCVCILAKHHQLLPNLES